MPGKSLLNDTFFLAVKERVFKNRKFEKEDFTFTQKECTSGYGLYALATPESESSIKYGVELLVNYIFHNDFYFRVEVFPDEYQVIRCPGSVIKTEEQTIKNRAEFFRCVEQWVDDLWEVITRDPLPISEEKTLEDLLGQFEEIPDAPFSKEDMESLHQKLDALETLLKSQIEGTIEDSKELKKKIAQLEADINFLKQATSNLTQKNWFGAAAAKLNKWRNRDKKESLLESEDFLQKYLLPEKNTNSFIEGSKTE